MAARFTGDVLHLHRLGLAMRSLALMPVQPLDTPGERLSTVQPLSRGRLAERAKEASSSVAATSSAPGSRWP